MASSRDGNSSTNNAEGTIHGEGIRKLNQNVTIGDNIKNPHAFYWFGNMSSTCNPNNMPYNNSWNAKNKVAYTASTPRSSAVEKTIYDPCPVGYTVSPANAYDKFANVAWNSNKGKIFCNCWFPAAGIRGLSDGNINNAGTNGFCWQTEPGGYLTFNNSSAIPLSTGGFLSTGLCIRPVSEDYK